MVVTLFVDLYLSENCVINALPGYAMVFFLAKNIKPLMILLCKLSIRLGNILFTWCERFDHIKWIILTERNMYACHHCHGYADDLDGSTLCFLKPSIGLGPRVPPVANGHFNYLNLFILYCKSTIQADITKATTKRPEANIWWATGYLVPGRDQQTYIVVSNLNILTKCLLHWFPSTSECEKMILHKLLHWTTILRFSDATSVCSP